MGNKEFHGAGRVAFMARKDEIKGMIDAGHPVRNVYRKFEGKLNISYGQFARYVNKLIKEQDNGNNDRKSDRETRKKTEPRRVREPGQPAFVSSDTPREDLVKPIPK